MTAQIIGSIAFAICGLPQAIKSIKDGHSDGISWGFLVLWIIGEVSTLVNVIILDPMFILDFTYSGSILFITIIIWYKLFRRRKK